MYSIIYPTIDEACRAPPDNAIVRKVWTRKYGVGISMTLFIFASDEECNLKTKELTGFDTLQGCTGKVGLEFYRKLNKSARKKNILTCAQHALTLQTLTVHARQEKTEVFRISFLHFRTYSPFKKKTKCTRGWREVRRLKRCWKFFLRMAFVRERRRERELTS